MTQDELKKRTKDFALRVARLVGTLPNTYMGRHVGGQLTRCSTSVPANYRAACRARSKAEFIAKMGIVEEEADESAFWLELCVETKSLPVTKLAELQTEIDEIGRIIAASRMSARAAVNRQPSGARQTAAGSQKGEGGSPNHSAIDNRQ